MTARKLIILFLFASSACSTDRTAEIDQSMRRYDNLILKMDVDGLANAYRTDGQMRGENQPAVIGRDSIRKFLGAFKSVKIFEYRSTTVSTVFKGDTARQEGTYFQKVQPPKSDTLELGGQYRATWIKGDDNKWLIQEMYTHDYRNLKKR